MVLGYALTERGRPSGVLQDPSVGASGEFLISAGNGTGSGTRFEFRSRLSSPNRIACGYRYVDLSCPQVVPCVGVVPVQKYRLSIAK